MSTRKPHVVPVERQLMPFDGDLRQYPTFRNQFLEIVESHPGLQPRHKLQYLLQFLRGAPCQLASGWQLTDANYFYVVDILEEWYGNEGMLRKHFIGEFVNLRSPKNEAPDIYRFCDTVCRLTSELKELGEDVDACRVCDQLLMERLSEKLLA